MKKWLIILILLLSSSVFAADTKLTALDALTAIATGDLLYIVDITANTFHKITVLDVFDMIDTFAELNTIVADKTLVNEETAATWDALGTFALGITITTGDPFTLGANRIDNGSDLIDGEQIADDTIDDDSIDFGDVTGADLTLTDAGAITSTGTITATVGFDIVGAADIDYGSVDVTDHTFVTDGTGTAEIVLPAGSIDGTEILDDTVDSPDYAAGSIDAEHLHGDIIDETKIVDDGIDSEHYNDGSIDLIHLAAGVYAKDLVTTSPITGAADNIFVGADSDVTVALDFTTAWAFDGNLSIGNATTTAGVLTLLEDDDDGANFASFMVPALAANTVYTLPPDDGDAGEQIQTDGSGTLTWEAAGGTTLYNNIGDPDAAGSISFDDGETATYTGANDGAISFFTIQNSDADHIGGNMYLLDLDYSADDGDADADFIKFQDSGSVVMTIQQDGEIATDGGLTAGGTVEGATLTEGGVAVHNNDEMDASSELRAIVDDETGGGLLVFNDNPTFDNGIIIFDTHDQANIVPSISFRRRRDGDPTNDVSNGDYIGYLTFSGYHTDEDEVGVEIRGVVDGTPGDDDMPSRLEFLTTSDGVDTRTLRMTIDSEGDIELGADDNKVDLTIHHAGVLTLYDASDDTSVTMVVADGTDNLTFTGDLDVSGAISGDGSALTAIDAATGDSATAFFDAGTIEHEYGGLEANINAYTGLVAITGGSTAEVDSKSELEGHIADVADFAEADGDTWTGTHDLTGATISMPKRTSNDDRFYLFNAWNPNALYDTDTQLCFEPNLPANITITEVTITLDADPTTELDWDLKWADAFIGLGNAALIVAIDTTSGTTDVDSGFDDATVAAGKCLYIEMAADPDSNITQAIVKIRYDFD